MAHSESDNPKESRSRRRKRRRPPREIDGERRYPRRGIYVEPPVMWGFALMVAAIIWFLLALSRDWNVIYPPVLFLVGLIRLVMGLLGHDDLTPDDWGGLS